MLSGIANELRRSIKTHRLAIDDRRTENIRIMAFDPSGHVHKNCKTGGVRFRKTVLAKPFNLTKASARKFFLVSTLQHATNELILESMNQSSATEGRHRTAQLIRLA